jgi:hypothetical protein
MGDLNYSRYQLFRKRGPSILGKKLSYPPSPHPVHLPEYRINQSINRFLHKEFDSIESSAEQKCLPTINLDFRRHESDNFNFNWLPKGLKCSKSSSLRENPFNCSSNDLCKQEKQQIKFSGTLTFKTTAVFSLWKKMFNFHKTLYYINNIIN